MNNMSNVAINPEKRSKKKKLRIATINEIYPSKLVEIAKFIPYTEFRFAPSINNNIGSNISADDINITNNDVGNSIKHSNYYTSSYFQSYAGLMQENMKQQHDNNLYAMLNQQETLENQAKRTNRVQLARACTEWKRITDNMETLQPKVRHKQHAGGNELKIFDVLNGIEHDDDYSANKIGMIQYLELLCDD
jgi:hypothetical protein